MASTNINVVCLTGNLTKDPELKTTTGGTDVCSLRLAVNTRRKDSNGDWMDKPNYFDVTTFGALARNCAEYLAKGRPVAVTGRLDWREWETQEGNKRQAVQVIADGVQFLNSGQRRQQDEAPSGDVPADTSGFHDEPVGASSADDDIPF